MSDQKWMPQVFSKTINNTSKLKKAQAYERKKVKEKFNYLAVLKETYKNNPIKLLLFKIGIKFTINKVRDRENFRFVRTKTFDMVRQIFREIDEELIKNNTIIFFDFTWYHQSKFRGNGFW